MLSHVLLLCMCCLFTVDYKICGNVHINAEEVEDSKCNVHMQMYATNLDKKTSLEKYAPYTLLAIATA